MTCQGWRNITITSWLTNKVLLKTCTSVIEGKLLQMHDAHDTEKCVQSNWRWLRLWNTAKQSFSVTHPHVRLTHPLFDVLKECVPMRHCSRVSSSWSWTDVEDPKMSTFDDGCQRIQKYPPLMVIIMAAKGSHPVMRREPLYKAKARLRVENTDAVNDAQM